MGEISVKTGNNARNGGKNSLNRLIRCVCGKKIGPDPRNFNQRVSLGRHDLLIRTFPNDGKEMWGYSVMSGESQTSNYIPGLALLKNSSTAHMKDLEIWFKGDVVERYTFRQTASKTSRGLLD
ncbi:hypothetical protein [Enterobacter roggenkampii]|uniref:hypothetical protein n=1 Tax=Enterobacter roggenkampii TaxID=1812935 RepID=UPI0019108100|nr:hypothetical protein [Enterobacter roggenkampii]